MPSKRTGLAAAVVTAGAFSMGAAFAQPAQDAGQAASGTTPEQQAGAPTPEGSVPEPRQERDPAAVARQQERPAREGYDLGGRETRPTEDRPHGIDPQASEERGRPQPRAEELRPDQREEPVATTLMEDRQITQRVVLNLNADPELAQRAIGVVTEDGMVTLRGEVASEDEAERALQIAAQTEDVNDVFSDLRVDQQLATETTPPAG